MVPLGGLIRTRTLATKVPMFPVPALRLSAPSCRREATTAMTTWSASSHPMRPRSSSSLKTTSHARCTRLNHGTGRVSRVESMYPVRQTTS